MSIRERAFKALRWSEKYTKTDMVYLTKGGFWLLLARASQVISGLILAVAFANLLAKDVYGTYQFAMSMAAILTTLSLTGISAAITRAVAQGKDAALIYGSHLRFIWSSTTTIISAVVALYYFTSGNSELAFILLIVGAFSPFLETFRLYRPFLYGKKDFQSDAILGLWRKPIPLVSLLVTVLLTDSPAILVLVYFFSHTVSAGLIYLVVLRRYNPPRKKVPEIINYSGHISIMSVIGCIANNVDRIVIFHSLGAASTAVYVLAQLPVKSLQSVLSAVSNLVFPKVSTKSYSTLKQTLPRKVFFYLLAIILLACIYVFSAPLIFKILFPSYLEAIKFTQVMALLLLVAPTSLFTQALVAHEKFKSLYIMRIIITMIKITLIIILVPVYGIWGAIWSLLIAQIFTISMNIFFFFRSA